MKLAQRKRDILRFTIIDQRGMVSFVGDSFYLQPLLAGCASGANTLDELLVAADGIDKRIRRQVKRGLAVFDEHNTEDDHESIQRYLSHLNGEDGPVVRVLDDSTLAESSRPTRTGFVIINLKERRIVQGQNLFGDIVEGEAHVHNGMSYSRQTVGYRLPVSWSVVP